jgi:hypothetical protein
MLCIVNFLSVYHMLKYPRQEKVIHYIS